MSMSMYIYIVEMLDCPASSQSSTGLKKLTMPGQVWYRTKLTQSGIFLVRYWTKIWDADAGVSFLDADAQLWLLEYTRLV
jgi:hypothetical protein